MLEYPQPLIALVRGTSWTSRLIRIGQRLRYRGKRGQFARWNHCAIVDPDGSIIQALGRGVCQSSGFAPGTEVELHALSLSSEDAGELIRYARSCLGTGYGYMTIVSIGLRLLSGSKLAFGVDNTVICSGLVAECLEHAGRVLPFDAGQAMPADIAEWLAEQEV